jgi:hypothetical protein
MLLHIWDSGKMEPTLEDVKFLFATNLSNVRHKRIINAYIKFFPKHYSANYFYFVDNSIKSYNEFYAMLKDMTNNINLTNEEKDKIKNIVETDFNANLEMIKEYVKYLSLFFDKTPLPKMSLPGLICEYSKKMSIISNKEIRPIDVMKSNEKVKDLINALSKIEYTKYSKPLFKFLDKTTTYIAEENEVKNYLVSNIPGYAQYKSILLSKLL